jgi:3-oxoacyl-[acyl-carrier-protein] synthase II
MQPRAVITGIGLVTPIGNGVEEYWAALTAGRSGVGPITLFDTTGFAVHIGGEVKNLDFSKYISAEISRKMSRASKLAVVAAKMAQEDAGLEVSEDNRDFIDVFMGVACPDLDTLAKNMVRRHEKGERGVNPLMAPVAVPSAPAGNIAITLGITGETLTISTACSSGANAMGHALRKIQSGASRVIFAGGVDTGVQADLIASYANAQVLSRRNEEPQRACRPFEAHRDGQVLSEAAVVLLIEEIEHARLRDALVYAELAGYGTTNDSLSMSAVAEDVKQAARSVMKALADAGRNGEEVDFYCAHGSASRVTDRRETMMLKAALGGHAYEVPVSGIKSMTGHPFGASGALQAATCALAIRRHAVPPTINYEEPDPECDLDYVPNTARQKKVGNALVYSLGMGNNAALLLAAC